MKLKSRIPALAAAACILAAAILPVAAVDWPRYRGPSENCITTEALPGAKLSVLWKKDIGIGNSAISVSDGKAYTMGNRNDSTTLYCFDAATGREIWKQSFPSSSKKNNFPGGKTPYHGGPNSTPNIEDGKVYTIGRFGQVACWGAADGKPVWSLDFRKAFPTHALPTWSYAASAVIVGNQLFIEPGGSGNAAVCVDKQTGKVLWKGGDQKAGYSTPTVAKVGGRQTLLVFHEFGIVGRDPANGKEFWGYPWKTSYGVNAAAPVVIDDSKIFISSGYGKGCALLNASGGNLAVEWKNKNMKNKHGVSIYKDGHIYGFSDATLACLDAKTGETVWKEKGLGKGAVSIAVDKLIIQAESCELVLAEASPAGYKELARTEKLFDGHSWTMPVLSGGRIYCRNISGKIVCLGVQ